MCRIPYSLHATSKCPLNSAPPSVRTANGRPNYQIILRSKRRANALAVKSRVVRMIVNLEKSSTHTTMLVLPPVVVGIWGAQSTLQT